MNSPSKVSTYGRTFGGYDFDEFNALAPAPGGGWVLAGFTKSARTGDFNGWLVRVDEQCHRVWERTFGGTGRDEFWTMAPAPGGGWLLAGRTEPARVGNFDGWWDFDGWIVWVDGQGNIVGK